MINKIKAGAIISIGFVALLWTAGSSVASNGQASTPAAISAQKIAGAIKVVPKVNENTTQSEAKIAYRGWRFLGCRRTHHSCHDLAVQYGYHHAKVRYNAYRCHHRPHRACYGR
ncbi:MAG: hypothetical protein L3J67_04585 [Hyphomicrobiaceae bacterium]|nr:hypothetical protein [Hyphomicrobiaceae bacterium]